MASLEEIEQKIDSSIQCAIDKGWTIKRGLTLNLDNNECCGLAAVLVCEANDRTEIPVIDRIEEASRRAGFEGNVEYFYVSFIDGFDNQVYRALSTFANLDVYEMGKRLAEKYIV